MDSTPIGDAERDATVTLLHAHMAAGHIDRAGLNQRLVWVKSATTQGELDAVTQFLPPLPDGAVEAVETAGRGVNYHRLMLWMIVLSPVLLVFLLWVTVPYWWVFFIVWFGIYLLLWRADRAAEAKARQ